MKTRINGYVMFFLVLVSFILNYESTYSQDNQQMPKDQSAVSKDEVPITTSSQQARDMFIQARDYTEDLQLEKAKPLLQDAIKADPDFALAYLYLSNAGGGFTTVKQNLDKAESLMDKASEGEKHLILFFKAQFEGNVSKEKDELQQLLSMFPNDKRVQVVAGTFEQFTNQNYDAAIQHYQKAVSIDPNYAPAYNILGYAYSGKNDFNKAEEAFKKYISLKPDSPNPYDSYAELLLKNGRYDASIEQYQKALSIDPTFVASIEGIGHNYLFKGDFAKARENYQELYDKSPNVSGKLNSLLDMATSYVREGNITEAISSLDKRASLAERENSIPALVNSHIMQGLILSESGKPDEAMKHFDIASEKVESSSLTDDLKNNLMSQVKLNKLYGMVSAGKLDAANSELQDKNEVVGSMENPQNEKQYESVMGLLALKQEKYNEAIEHFSRADGENPLNWYYMAVAYQKSGDDQKAAQLMDKIKQSNQNSLALSIANHHVKENVVQTK